MQFKKTNCAYLRQRIVCATARTFDKADFSPDKHEGNFEIIEANSRTLSVISHTPHATTKTASLQQFDCYINTRRNFNVFYANLKIFFGNSKKMCGTLQHKEQASVQHNGKLQNG